MRVITILFILFLIWYFWPHVQTFVRAYDDRLYSLFNLATAKGNVADSTWPPARSKHEGMCPTCGGSPEGTTGGTGGFEGFAQCGCARNVIASDVRLNPFYYPYSADSCIDGQMDKSLRYKMPEYLDVNSLTVPDHVMLTN